jgi:hypothetical protein
MEYDLFRKKRSLQPKGEGGGLPAFSITGEIRNE